MGKENLREKVWEVRENGHIRLLRATSSIHRAIYYQMKSCRLVAHLTLGRRKPQGQSLVSHLLS